MNYKVQGALHKNKKNLIIFAILWGILSIVFIMPLAYSITEATVNEVFQFDKFLAGIFTAFTKFGTVIPATFTAGYFETFLNTLVIFSIGYAVFAIIGLIRTAPKNEFSDIEHGSSDWAKNGEQYRILNNKKGIILARDNYLPTDKRGNVNVLVVGGSGSGKSASYSIPNAYQMLGSYIFTDPKGELYDITAGYLRDHGYEIKVLNLVRPQNSDGYNPLMHISNEIDVDVIANTIVKGQKTDSGSDPYWDDMAEMLLKALIYYLIATRPVEEQNLASCAELVRAANNNGGSNLLTELMNQLPIDHPARMNYKSIEIAPEKTYGSILSSLQSKLGKFDSKEIAELTSTDTIKFDEIAEKKTAVYVISSDTHTAYDFLLTIFFSQMIQQLYDFADKSGGKLPIPTYFILDEFANIGKIPDFDKKISTSRSRKISFSVILQNLDQLEAVYEKSYETIIGNCDTHLFLGSNSQKTVEYFSKALGEKTIERESLSINKDNKNKKQGKSISDQAMARALMTPDELRRMDNDNCIIFVKGLKPIKAKKYYYFEGAMAKKLRAMAIDHNDIGELDRGIWRKYNPYNPYVEEDKKKQVENLKVESLDDLFEEEPKEEKKKPEPSTWESPEKEEAPELPQEPELDIDLQKELEAKFDELFGPMSEE